MGYDIILVILGIHALRWALTSSNRSGGVPPSFCTLVPPDFDQSHGSRGNSKMIFFFFFLPSLN